MTIRAVAAFFALFILLCVGRPPAWAKPRIHHCGG
jgi:hypothetical protein